MAADAALSLDPIVRREPRRARGYPTPQGFPEASVRPEAAFWPGELGEFALPYEAVRTAPSPDDALLDFFESTHAAAAELAGWDRDALERDRDYRPVPRWRR